MNDTQKACPHVFIGRADGVHCTRCGLHLTARQYHELLHPPESRDEQLDAGKIGLGEMTAESVSVNDLKTGQKAEPVESVAEAPQEKPKRTRKKKEVTANG